MNPILSIAVICYNNKKFIKGWIDSILSQEVSFPIEVVVTDDCSTDGSWEELKKYQKVLAQKHIRCKLYKTKENSGVGPTRHNSLMNCSGKYVLFLDGDDHFVGNRSFLMLIDFAEEHKSDCVIFGSYGRSVNWACGTRTPEIVEYEPRAACASVLNGSDTVVVWNKLWKREAIRDIEYPLLRSNEDTIATPIWLWHCNNVIQVPVVAYFYAPNEESLTRTYCPGKDPEKRKIHLQCMDEARRFLKDFFVNNDPELLPLVK